MGWVVLIVVKLKRQPDVRYWMASGEISIGTMQLPR
jgi:hypothetical protein